MSKEAIIKITDLDNVYKIKSGDSIQLSFHASSDDPKKYPVNGGRKIKFSILEIKEEWTTVKISTEVI